MKHTRAKQAGFTLIELMIVVVVVAILAAIAFPQYRDYVVRSNRAVAKSLLVQVADRQEQFFTDRKTYASDMTDLGYPDATTIYVDRSGNPSGADPGDALYSVVLSNAGATTFTLTATPLNAQADDTKCTAMAINQSGQRTSTPAGSKCW
jgi:type IV pilus assembly protein PilE